MGFPIQFHKEGMCENEREKDIHKRMNGERVCFQLL